MTDNFLHKDSWSKEDWAIYFYNLNLLRESSSLSKNEFNTQVGVVNAFRKDQHSVSKGTILTICKIFNITEVWLVTDHRNIHDPLLLKESNHGCDLSGGDNPEVGKLLKEQNSQIAIKFFEILESGTPYAEALQSSINAFHKALNSEKKATGLKNQQIENMSERITALERKDVAAGG